MNQADFRCFECKKRLALSHHGFCSRCVRLLEKKPYCGHCGMPLLEFSMQCGECLKQEPKWQRLVRIAMYQKPLSDWIHRFKFQQQYWLDKPLARLLLLSLREAKRTHGLQLPEVIMPVPLYWQRHWWRGYNQATLLARPLATWLNLPLEENAISRIRATQPQRELTAKARRHNLQNAFCYAPKKHYERVALVDDVVTTGSTINAIARVLQKQGVKEIQVWTLARA